mgnify:FL=1
MNLLTNAYIVANVKFLEEDYSRSPLITAKNYPLKSSNSKIQTRRSKLKKSIQDSLV